MTFCLLLTLPVFAQTSEAGVIAEINQLRTHPREYAQRMRALRDHYHGLVYQNGARSYNLHEGLPALDEAITFLEAQPPVPPLTASRGLTLAARDHANEQGATGAVGHGSADGSRPLDRVCRYGTPRKVGENLCYGWSDPSDIVMQLVIDDGVPDRGHRLDFFTPEFDSVGVACGPHSRMRIVCVIDMASSYLENPAAQTGGAPVAAATVSAPPARPAVTTGSSFAAARGTADANYADAVAGEREAWRDTLSAANRASTYRLWSQSRAQSYSYACTEKMEPGRLRFRYLRRPELTPCFITLVLENGRWLVDEVGY